MKTKRIVALALVLVMLFAFTGCKDKPSGNVNDNPTTAGILYAGFDWAYEDLNTKENYLKAPDKFKDAAKNNYGLTDEQIADFVEDNSNWNFYAIDLTIHNNTAVSYTFVGFAASGMPDGMWLNTLGDFELTVPANLTDQTYPASILVDSSKVNKVEMYNALADLALEVLYFETPADGSDEVPESGYKKLKVTNNLVAPDADTAPEKQLSAKRTTIEDGSSFLETYRKNPTAFSSEAKLFGIDSATASEVLVENSGWEWYTLNIEIENKTTEDLNIYAVVTANNGNNGVWVCNVSQYGEFGMPANDKQALPVSVLVDTSALGGRTAEAAIAEAEIQLEYFVGDFSEDMFDEDTTAKRFIDVK